MDKLQYVFFFFIHNKERKNIPIILLTKEVNAFYPDCAIILIVSLVFLFPYDDLHSNLDYKKKQNTLPVLCLYIELIILTMAH